MCCKTGSGNAQKSTSHFNSITKSHKRLFACTGSPTKGKIQKKFLAQIYKEHTGSGHRGGVVYRHNIISTKECELICLLCWKDGQNTCINR